MGLSNSIGSYEDLVPVLERALEAERGIRIDAKTPGAAIHFRQRLYKLRSLSREQSLDVYAPGDPQRGTSAWDNLSIEITPGSSFILIKKRPPMEIEEL
jgi:hypothetical protein